MSPDAQVDLTTSSAPDDSSTSSTGGNPSPIPDIAERMHIWEEYKYRHDLCWRAVYKVSAAVIVLSILPYAQREVATRLGPFVVVPPVLAALLAIFGVFLLRNELHIFAKTADVHHQLQDQFLTTGTKPALITKPVKYTIKRLRELPKFDFAIYVYLTVLIVLAVGNAFFVRCRWFPTLRASAEYIPPRD